MHLVPQGRPSPLQVEAIAQEPYASFDKAADRIERRLRDHRKRAQGRHGDNGHASELDASAAEALALPPLSEIEDDGRDGMLEDEPRFPAVVAEHASGVTEMTVAAAVEKLDAGDCPVVVFRYAENRRINFVYRRGDGNVGWIDPLGVTNGHSS